MHNSERYPYLTCIDSQALLAQCEKKEIKDGLSVLTQYLHNRKYLSPAGLNEALSFMAEEVLDKEGSGRLALKDDHLELFFKEFFEVPFPGPETPKFSFIDLFAGMGDGINPHRLTPRECARLMGYPDEYIINAVSEVQAYRQCGNSVVVPLVTAVAEQLVKTMKKKV